MAREVEPSSGPEPTQHGLPERVLVAQWLGRRKQSRDSVDLRGDVVQLGQVRSGRSSADADEEHGGLRA